MRLTRSLHNAAHKTMVRRLLALLCSVATCHALGHEIIAELRQRYLCEGDGCDDKYTVAAPQTIADRLVSQDEFKTLASAAMLSNLFYIYQEDMLNTTLFAPVNTAFEQLPQETLLRLLSPDYGLHLLDVLSYHTYIGLGLTSDQLTNNARIPMAQRLGEFLRVEVDAFGNIRLLTEAELEGLVTYPMSAQIVDKNLTAVNGVVHAIDRVLLPKFAFRDMLDVLGANEDRFSILIELISTADLNATLMEFEGTLFAPNNAAMQAAKSTVDLLRQDVKRLTAALQFHLLPEVFNFEVIPDMAEIPTVLGPTITFDPNKETQNEIIVGVTRQPIFESQMTVDYHLYASGIIYEMPVIFTVPTVLDELTAQGRTQFSTLITGGAGSTPRFISDLGNRANEFTLFAPSNEAFDKLPPGVKETLLLPAFGKHLYDILSYHLAIGERLTLDELEDGQVLLTNQRDNETLTVIKNDLGIFLMTETGLEPSQIVNATNSFQAANGIVHQLDTILFPRFIFKNVLQVLNDNSDKYSIFLDLAEAAGLLPYLQGFSGTLLAPSNDAFLAVGNESLAELLSEPSAIMTLLSFHIIPDVVINNNVNQANTEFFTMYGPPVILSNQVTPTFDNIRSPAFELFGAGIIYELEAFLIPPDVLEIIRKATSFTTFERLLDQTQLSNIIDTDQRILTIFAPNEGAFRSLPAAIFRDLQTPAFSLHLFDILAYHIHLDSAIFTEDMSKGDLIPTLQRQGETLQVNTTSVFASRRLKEDKNNDKNQKDPIDILYSLITNQGRIEAIPDTNIVLEDLTAFNGVVHGVDRVNLPRFMYQNAFTTLSRFAERFGALAQVVTEAGLESTLTTLRGTFLAPSIAAQSKVCFDFSEDDSRRLEDKYYSKTPCLTKDDTTAVLRYHIIQNNIFNYANGVSGETLRTIQGTDISTDFLTEGIVAFRGATNRVESDAYFLYLTGLVYQVDGFLIPPGFVNTAALSAFQ